MFRLSLKSVYRQALIMPEQELRTATEVIAAKNGS
jgi:hypothetical protein